MAVANSDGSIILKTNVDTSGMQKGTKSLRSEAMKLAAEYRKAGMSQSEAQKRAYKELGVTTKETEKAKKVTKEYGEEAEKAGGKASRSFSSLSSGLKSIGKTALKASLAIGAVAGAAIIALTKQAVTAYADYEQLIGGVDTLFQDSSQKLQDYASQAYKTAGVSANQYMQQVTSFSASLISSLGGDTDKAADVANMALIDMADNANKMGTVMESIQYAYQGFAKQNYTMLDNLKLGYGGTKTEMERLLRDAEAMTGVKYDISNLSDVYNAIHVIQQQLNITGTTALESEKTITGSLNSTKAAWEDLTVALAGGGDIDRAIKNLTQSLEAFLVNVTPTINRALIGIANSLPQIMPMLTQMLAKTLIQSLPVLIKAIYQSIIGLAQGIAEGIKALLMGATPVIANEVNSAVGGISTAVEGMEDLEDATDKAGKTAKKALAGFDELNAISFNEENAGDLNEITLPSVAGGTVQSVVETKVDSESLKVADTRFKTFFDGLKVKLEPIKENFDKIVTATKEWVENVNFNNLINGLASVGNSLLGVLASISDYYTFVYVEVLLPLTEWAIERALPDALDVVSEALDFVGEVLNVVILALKAFFDEIEPITSFLGDVVTDVLWEVQQLFEQLAEVISDKKRDIVNAFENIGEAITALQPIFEAVWFVAQNILSFAAEVITTYVSNFIDIMLGFINFVTGVFTLDWEQAWDGILQILSGAFELFKGMWSNLFDFIVDVFEPIVTWVDDKIVEPIGNFFSALWSNVLNGVGNFVGALKMKLQPIITWIKNNIINPLKTAFTSFANFNIAIFNTLLGGIETFINAFVKGVNRIIDAANELSFSVPNWIPEIGGKSFGINLTKISSVSLSRIPELAQGAVIPGGREFLAVLGDQPRGQTNIEAPLSTIKQALAEVMQEWGNNNQNISIQIDGHELIRAVRNAESRSGGMTMTGGIANVY